MPPSSARIISWDTNTKSTKLRLTEEDSLKKSRKRTAGDDRVSDGTNQPPPQKKAAVVQQSAQPSSHAIIAAPTAASSSGYRGVYWIEKDRVFHAQIKHNYKTLYVGASADAKEAAFMRDRACRDLGKNPNLLNFDDTVPVPNEYLASVANASKKVASHTARAALPPPPPPLALPPPPPPLQQSAQPSYPAIAAPTAASSPAYRGVSWSQRDRVFRAQVRHNNKHLHVGQSADAKEAAFMRDRAWRDLGKDPSELNFDDTVTIPDEYLASVAKARKKVASHVVQQIAQQPSSVAIAAPSAGEAIVLETAAPSSSGDPVPDGPAHGSAVGSSKLSRLIKMLVLH